MRGADGGPKNGGNQGVPLGSALVPWESGHRVKRGHNRWSATELRMRLGVGLGRVEGKDLPLIYLLPCLEWPVDSQERG